jgi:phenylalanyl-tRNA synthetase alpha chain
MADGFVRVSTPVLMSKGLLAKMSITAEHPLFDQVFWVTRDKCLRPMLAPHLYYLMKDLLRLWEKPVRIFEVGPCFRKETEGARHAAEFTMLNLCEFGLPEEDRQARLEQLATRVVAAAGIDDYKLVSETSAVYGSTLDVVSTDEGMELGSGAMGPHPLDRAWKITDTWIGIGFGLERLLMAAQGGRNLARYGRSITYLDGIRLNI